MAALKFVISRLDGTFTPLITADELSSEVDLQETPHVLRYEEVRDRGLVCLAKNEPVVSNYISACRPPVTLDEMVAPVWSDTICRDSTLYRRTDARNTK